MKQTSLKLLTRDGAITVIFHDTLSPEEYEAVYDCVKDSADADELRQCLRLMASEWGMTVTIEAAI